MSINNYIQLARNNILDLKYFNKNIKYTWELINNEYIFDIFGENKLR
jgi:hypothetical protein